MKLVVFTFFNLLLAAQASVAQQSSGLHQPWTELLQKHVETNGWVSYNGLRSDSIKLNLYLQALAQQPPTVNWSCEQKLAYWINAYNAFTAKLIVDNYPVSSIKDIKKGIPFFNSVWDLKFFEIGDEKMNLNQIEHSILRKQFDEPRIHFSIVCASVSCPKLRNEAFEAQKLEQQLQDQANDFINDSTKNKIEKDQLQLSSIFKWFELDFTKETTLKEYIQKYAKLKFEATSKVKYMDYNWNLNGE
ncbi:MAG: DUF547 domain-containing protein [Flavobacteriales bacterium]|nr:DUF547 domain-containing protein [Flavobacteriales bacterium]